MSVVLITGSAGLIGSEAVRFFAGLGHQVVGLDNLKSPSFNNYFA
jgi:CDP-paratose 2-epimerase